MAEKYILNPEWVVENCSYKIAKICEQVSESCTDHVGDREGFRALAIAVKNKWRKAAIMQYRNMDTSARERLSKQVCGQLADEVACYFEFTWLR